MNGIHDMGGMHGMGPIEAEKNEPVFHARWEARVFALRRAMGAWGKWNIDATRYQVELVPPAPYLELSYYARQLVAFLEMLPTSDTSTLPPMVLYPALVTVTVKGRSPLVSGPEVVES